jgi:hypothetical protein
MSRIQIRESSSYVTSRGRDGAKLMWIFLILVLPPLFASLPSPKYQTLRFDPIGLAPIGLAPDWKEDIYSGDPRYESAMTAIQKGARDRANEICKDGRCCCKKVTIRSVFAPGGNPADDFFNSKSLSTEVITCSR